MTTLAFTVIGGLGLFLLGMALLTEGLRLAAKDRLRDMLTAATRHRANGIALGTVMGLLMHSGPSVALCVGFVNAGLMTLAQALPPIFGANIGTTLSLQLISFKLGAYCYLLIGAGMAMRLFAVRPRLPHLGNAVLGLGLLFLGISTMAEAIGPHREALAGLVSHIHGDSLAGMLAGIAVGTLVTAAVQSSGLAIGMVLVLLQAGVLHDAGDVLPLILGANLGKCAPALYASLGTHIVAKRAALAHLLFNAVAVVLGIIAAPWYLDLARALSTVPAHQAAHLYTLSVTVPALLLLPFTRQCAAVVTRLVAGSAPLPEASYLDRHQLAKPETALAACLLELRRMARLCVANLELNKRLFCVPSPADLRALRRNEDVVDEVKVEMRQYLEHVTDRYLSRRQSLLAEHLNNCMIQLERIADHLEFFCDLRLRQRRDRRARFNEQTSAMLFGLLERTEEVLLLVAQSFDQEAQRNQAHAAAIAERRAELDQRIECFSHFYIARIASHDFPARVGIYLGEYVMTLRRIATHAAAIAQIQREADFWIKPEKLDRVVEAPPDAPPPHPHPAPGDPVP
jgi:phosphate:Na+ symporter